MKPANKIRQARHAAGLTQEQLARACGCGVRNVPAWESGQRQPRTAMLQRIAEACQVTIAELRDEEATSEAARLRTADPFASALRELVRSALSEEVAAIRKELAARQHDRRQTQAPISVERRGALHAVSA